MIRPTENSATLAYVEADLNYVVDTGTPPVMYVDWPEEEHKAIPPLYEAHRCKIYDARPITSQFGLATHGFEMKRIPSKVIDFYDKDEVERVYNREVAAIIKKAMVGTRWWSSTIRSALLMMRSSSPRERGNRSRRSTMTIRTGLLVSG